MEPTNRYLALELAIRGGSGDSTILNATTYLAFLEGDPQAPKAPRAKKSTTSPTSEQPSSPQTQKPAEEPSSPSSEKSSETSSSDLFGSDEPAKEEPKAEPKKEKAKPLTQDNVRDALVSVQTALKSKDAAIDILKTHTTGGVGVLSKLPESAYAALIKECQEAVAKAPK